MSNKTQLQQNNLEYDSLIELLSGKPTDSNVILQEKTITPTISSQTVESDNGYDGLSKVVVNAMPTATQATPSITISSSGLITATSSQNAGYVTSGTKSATKQLTTQGAKTITPSTSSQTAVASGVYTTGAITVKGDVNLVASNIKSGVSIFDVTGSYEGSSGKDMLQARVDATNNCYYLFSSFTGTNVDFIANLDTSRVTSMESMFHWCTSLITIPQLDTSRVTNMSYMFYYCVSLTSIPVLNTSKVTSMKRMFEACSKLTSIPELNTSNVINMADMFHGCSKLTSVPALNTSKVTDMGGMFDGCSNLTSIPALDTSQATYMYDMFDGCSNLTSILMTGMKVNFDISASTKFTREALVTILNNLGIVTSTKTLTMGSTNLAKLTNADKAIATNKGWTLA